MHSEGEEPSSPKRGDWWWDGKMYLKEELSDRSLQLHSQKTALPSWGKLLDIKRYDHLFRESIYDSMAELHAYEILVLISSMIVGPGHGVRDFLFNMRYIGPLRELPQRSYYTPFSPDRARWASGIAAWDTFHEDDNKLIKKTNEWLTHENHLNSGYKVEVKSYRELPDETNIMKILSDDSASENREKTKELLDNLPVKKQVFLRDQKRDILVKPQDVGTGISQVLPVIVGALNLESGLMIVEQPELHIHPALQVALGDLFISQTNDKKTMFLLETHSEHLMLRFLRRIRETSENELPKDQFKLTAEQLAVYFVETDETGMNLTAIRVDSDGDFIDRWPHGFFGERIKEIF